MRNLTKYPITREEILGALDDAIERLDTEYNQLIGDIRPIALRAAKDALLARWDEEPEKPYEHIKNWPA